MWHVWHVEPDIHGMIMLQQCSATETHLTEDELTDYQYASSLKYVAE